MDCYTEEECPRLELCFERKSKRFYDSRFFETPKSEANHTLIEYFSRGSFVRELCILILLAKYQGPFSGEKADAPIKFKEKSERVTWLKAFGIAFIKDSHRKIFKDCFGNIDFITASRGSAINGRKSKGKENSFAWAQYHPFKLRLHNVHIFITDGFKKGNADPEVRKSKLRMLAKALEDTGAANRKRKWKRVVPEMISDIDADRPSKKSKNSLNNAKTNPPDEKTVIQTQLLVEREFDAFHGKCKPFYSFLKKRFHKILLLDKDRLYFFLNNLRFHFSAGSDTESNLRATKSRLFNGERIEPEFDDALDNLIIRVDRELEGLQRRVKLKTDNAIDFASIIVNESTLLLKETKSFYQTLSNCLETLSRFSIFGTVIAVQWTYLDFLSEACYPLVKAIHDNNRWEEDLLPFIKSLKGEYLINLDFLRRNYIHQRNSPEVLQGAKPLFKAHLHFLKAVKRQLNEI